MMRALLIAALAAAACLDFDRGLELCMQHGGCVSLPDGGVALDAGDGPIDAGAPDAGALDVGMPDASLTMPDGGLDAGPSWRVELEGGALEGLPVLVTLQPVHTAGVVDAEHDLRFAGPAGEDLPFELEQFDAGGDSSLWVRLPALDAGQQLTLFTGPGARGAAAPGAVWSGWELVHHFGPDLRSSVDERYAAVRSGSTPGPGVVGDATYFPGMGNALVTFADGGALLNGWDQFTLTFWLYADYAAPNAVPGSPEFMDKGGSLDHGQVSNGGTRFQLNLHFTGGNNANLGGPLPLRQWVDVVYTFDGTQLEVYAGGQLMASQAMMGGAQQLMSATNAFYLGHSASQLCGAIDELRIEKRVHDATWIAAQHRSLDGQQIRILPP
jgi:hypothetical protein